VVLTTSTGTHLAYTLTWAGGISWQIDWTLDGNDLVLNTSAVPGGTGNPDHWTTVFTGDIPRAGGGGCMDSGVSIAIGTGAITTRYVVITADFDIVRRKANEGQHQDPPR
jgi:hypothetical protein